MKINGNKYCAINVEDSDDEDKAMEHMDAAELEDIR
jgi:hypothetical protein